MSAPYISCADPEIFDKVVGRLCPGSTEKVDTFFVFVPVFLSNCCIRGGGGGGHLPPPSVGSAHVFMLEGLLLRVGQKCPRRDDKT